MNEKQSIEDMVKSLKRLQLKFGAEDVAVSGSDKKTTRLFYTFDMAGFSPADQRSWLKVLKKLNIKLVRNGSRFSIETKDVDLLRELNLPNITIDNPKPPVLRPVQRTGKGASSYTYMLDTKGLSKVEQKYWLSWYESQGIEFEKQSGSKGLVMTETSVERFNKERKPVFQINTPDSDGVPPKITVHDTGSYSKIKTVGVLDNSNADLVRRRMLHTIPDFMTFADVYMDPDVVYNLGSGDLFKAADMGTTLPFMLAKGVDNYEEVFTIATDIARTDGATGAFFKEFFQMYPRAFENLAVGIFNTLGLKTMDRQQDGSAYQENTISYQAEIKNGRLVNGQEQKYRLSYLVSSLDEKSGVLNVYTPVAGTSFLYRGEDENGKKNDLYKTEAAYDIENGRVVRQRTRNKDGVLEVYYYDNSEPEVTPCMRLTDGNHKHAITDVARNELEALYGKFSTAVLEDIKIGRRTHCLRRHPDEILSVDFCKDEEEGVYVFKKDIKSSVEKEYYLTSARVSTLYQEERSVTHQEFAISKDKIDEWLKDKNWTKEDLEHFVKTHKSFPLDLQKYLVDLDVTVTEKKDKPMTIVGERHYATVTGLTPYMHDMYASGNMGIKEKNEFRATLGLSLQASDSGIEGYTGSNRVRDERLLRIRNTPEYAVGINPYLRNKYATYKRMEIVHQEDEKGVAVTYYETDPLGKGRVDRVDYFKSDKKGESRRVSSEEYIYKPEYKVEPSPKSNCYFQFDEMGNLSEIIDAKRQEYYGPLLDRFEIGLKGEVYFMDLDGQKFDVSDKIDVFGKDEKTGKSKCLSEIKKEDLPNFSIASIKNKKSLDKTGREILSCKLRYDADNQLVAIEDAQGVTFEGEELKKLYRDDGLLCFRDSRDIPIVLNEYIDAVGKDKQTGKVKKLSECETEEEYKNFEFMSLCRKNSIGQDVKLPTLTPYVNIDLHECTPIEKSSEFLRFKKIEDKTNADTYSVYTSDGSVAGAVRIDESGLVYYYGPDGNFLSASVVNENHQSDWAKDPDSPYFCEVAKGLYLAKYQALRQKGVYKCIQEMKKWFLLSDETIDKTATPVVLHSVKEAMKEVVREDNPAYAREFSKESEAIFADRITQTVIESVAETVLSKEEVEKSAKRVELDAQARIRKEVSEFETQKSTSKVLEEHSEQQITTADLASKPDKKALVTQNKGSKKVR